MYFYIQEIEKDLNFNWQHKINIVYKYFFPTFLYQNAPKLTKSLQNMGKTVKKQCFGQGMLCTAPIIWSSYTTFNWNWANANHELQKPTMDVSTRILEYLTADSTWYLTLNRGWLLSYFRITISGCVIPQSLLQSRFPRSHFQKLRQLNG